MFDLFTTDELKVLVVDCQLGLRHVADDVFLNMVSEVVRREGRKVADVLPIRLPVVPCDQVLRWNDAGDLI